LNKKVLALGGAKNHLVAAKDCHVEMTALDVVNSFTGCAGQRCMAASVLLTIGSQKELIASIIEKATAITPGQSSSGHMGPIIDQQSLNKIIEYIKDAESGGAHILLDGRSWLEKNGDGFWIGPTIIKHQNIKDKALHDEIFGDLI
jgi:acyl-CoA reductase-like NAD-dependent aldehyde dehydrogenase